MQVKLALAILGSAAVGCGIQDTKEDSGRAGLYVWGLEVNVFEPCTWPPA